MKTPLPYVVLRPSTAGVPSSWEVVLYGDDPLNPTRTVALDASEDDARLYASQVLSDYIADTRTEIIITENDL